MMSALSGRRRIGFLIASRKTMPDSQVSGCLHCYQSDGETSIELVRTLGKVMDLLLILVVSTIIRALQRKGVASE